MNITVNRKEFINALSIGGAMAGKCSTMPILNTAKIELVGNVICISSFDLECAITTKMLSISNDNNGEFCVSVSDLSKALKSLNSENVTMTVTSATLSITHSAGVMEMPILDTTAFPNLSNGTADDKNILTIPSALLKEWIGVGKNFVSNDEFRIVMNGLYMNITPTFIEVCATDAHKLYTDKRDITLNSNVNIEAVLPTRSFVPLLNILETVDTISMLVDNKNFTFYTPSTELKCRKIEGNFPNFRAVIPQHTNSVTANKNEFVAAVNRVGLFSNKETSLVKLNIFPDSIVLDGRDIDFNMSSMETVCAATNNNSTLSIGAKADFLSLCLRCISSDNVTMLYGNDCQPMLFTDSVSPNKRMILMPMLIQ